MCKRNKCNYFPGNSVVLEITLKENSRIRHPAVKLNVFLATNLYATNIHNIHNK